MSVTPRPEVVPPGPWTFPAYERRELDNGASVLVYHLPGQHVASAGIAVPAPLASEPTQTEGVATIMARTLDEGTTTHSATEFAELLERRGVAFGAGMSESGLTVTVDAPRRHLDYALDLLTQSLREPAFPHDEVDRQRKTRIAEIAHDRVNPSSRAALELVATFYDGRERASRPSGGSSETVSAISRDDVADFHATHVHPRGATIVLAGDFTDHDPFASVERTLGGWSGGSPDTMGEHPDPPGRYDEPRLAPDRHRIVFLDRPGAVQTEIAVATSGPGRDVTGGWAPYPVLSFIVGGSPTARVDAVLREELGYTYGIRSVFRPRRVGGLFLTAGSVRGDVTAHAVDVLMQRLESGLDGFTPAEARAGIDYVAKTAPGRFTTADIVADEALSLSLDRLSTDFATQMFHDVQALDVDVLTEAYRRFIGREWTIVLVGDASRHADAVAALGRGQVSVREA